MKAAVPYHAASRHQRRHCHVRFGSWLCKNAERRDGDRMNILRNRIRGRKDFDVEIRCQRAGGIDRAFTTDKDLDSLRAERPSESTLAYSAETLLFSIIASCLYHVGEPVDVRAGLLSKKHVDAIVKSVRLEMDEIKKANEVWREAEIVTKAARGGTCAETLKSRCRDLDCTLSRYEPHPANAAEAKSVLLRLLQSWRRRRRTRRVRRPEKGLQLAEELELTSQGAMPYAYGRFSSKSPAHRKRVRPPR